MSVAATSTAAPAPATASAARPATVARPAGRTSGRVWFEPEVGRFRPGSRPDRIAPGRADWRRFPNHVGGSAAMHPDDTAHYIANGIRFEDGRFARVLYVEREAFVDVVHFHFVTQGG